MSENNLGRVQGGGFYGSSSDSTVSIPKSTITSTGVTPLVGDIIINSNGDILKIVSVASSSYTVSKQGTLRGPKGDSGSDGNPGEDGLPGKDGTKWFTGTYAGYYSDATKTAKVGDYILITSDYSTISTIGDIFEITSVSVQSAANLCYGTKVGNIRGQQGEDGISFSETGEYPKVSTGRVLFAVCSTSSSVQNKVVDLPVYSPGTGILDGTRIVVKFTYANSIKSPTLNVGGSGGYTIIADNDTVNIMWKAGDILEFVYDKSNYRWVCIGGYALKGYPVGSTYIGETSPASIFGGSWTEGTVATEVSSISVDTGYISCPASQNTVLHTFTIPKDCYAVIDGWGQSNTGDNSTIQNINFYSYVNGIGWEMNARTTLSYGGGCVLARITAPENNDRTVQCRVYNYRTSATSYKFVATVLFMKVKKCWTRTA